MTIRERTIDHLVIGSGAAGFRAALALDANGEKNIAIITENRKGGTSRNTGSDKQTYYKLSVSGAAGDSVRSMAEDYAAGQCMDGDIAYCEAALSARGFFHLVELGVPFPSNEYGAYMGYQTDHDTRSRATSAGPYTSRLMTEKLEADVMRRQIEILDSYLAIRLLVRYGQIRGVLCLTKETEGEDPVYMILWCRTLILATGGPAGMYHNSVYPVSQFGSSGMAFEAGIKGKNLTEWQFGLASVAPRWNVSGTYMQVLPTFISTDPEGKDEKEFLLEYYPTREEMLSMVFLKGYQWPFDTAKIYGGSSVIDLLVYREIVLRGRRVFLDFRRNSQDEPIPFERLSEEARTYLEKAGAMTGTPIERLHIMNEPAISFYRDHQVDLEKEMLEVAICAQHNNGGLSADAHWETDIRGVFAVGEVCGSHGVTRPGGSALNAGQVGAIRAAEKIHQDVVAGRLAGEMDEQTRQDLRREAENMASLPAQAKGSTAVGEAWTEAAKQMSAVGGMVRDRQKIEAYLEKITADLMQFPAGIRTPDKTALFQFYRLRDMLIAQKMYLTAMRDYAAGGGKSRGSGLYTDPEGKLPDASLPALFCTKLDQRQHAEVIQEVSWNGGNVTSAFRPVRPVPDPEDFFENEWKAFRIRMGL